MKKIKSNVYRLVKSPDSDNSSPNRKGKLKDMVVEPVLPYRSVMTRYKEHYSPSKLTYLRSGEMSTRNIGREISRSHFDLSKLTSRNGSRNVNRNEI